MEREIRIVPYKQHDEERFARAHRLGEAHVHRSFNPPVRVYAPRAPRPDSLAFLRLNDASGSNVCLAHWQGIRGANAQSMQISM